MLDLLGGPLLDTKDAVKKQVENRQTRHRSRSSSRYSPMSITRASGRCAYGDLKLIHRLTDNYLELYDLAADPLERVNLIDTHPGASALRDLPGRYIDRTSLRSCPGKSGARLPLRSPPKRKPRAKRKRKPRPKTRGRGRLQINVPR